MYCKPNVDVQRFIGLYHHAPNIALIESLTSSTIARICLLCSSSALYSRPCSCELAADRSCAMQICEKLLGSSHSNTILVRKNLARLQT